MAELTVIVSAEGGTTYTLGAVSASDTFDNDGSTILIVTNGGASSDTVSFTGVGACNYGVTHNTSVAVANATSKVFGPFNTAHFNDSTGHVTVTHTYTTTVTCAAVRVPRVV